MSALVVLLPVLVVFAWAAILYNGLEESKIRQAEAWRGVEAGLERLKSIAPALAECVHATPEAAPGSCQGAAASRHAHDPLREIRNHMAIAEIYPEIKASEAFQKISSQVAQAESALRAASDAYNAAASTYKYRANSFPAKYIAAIFGFQAGARFETDPAVPAGR